MKIFIFAALLLLPVIESKATNFETDSEITENLNILLNAKGMDQYTVYLLMMPKPMDILANTAADIVEINAKTIGGKEPYKHQPYKLTNGERSIALTTNQEIFKSAMVERSIFVTLSKVGVKVPVRTAEKIAAGFSNGFATHVFLTEHVKEVLAKIDPDLKIDLGLSLDGRYLLEATAYNSGTAFALNEKTTPDQLDETIDRIDLNSRAEMAGILLGWEASARLQEMRSTNAPAYQAAHKLLAARFTPESMGRAVSYTLTVLQAAGSIKAAVEQGVGSLAAADSQLIGGKGLSEVIQTFREKKISTGQAEIVKPSDLASLCFELTLAKLVDTTGAPESRRRQLDFIKGYLSGAQAVSSEVMNYAITQGYSAGLKRGYEDGYKVGIEAGRIAGTNAGKEDGYNTGLVVVDKLNGELRKVKNGHVGDFFGGVLLGFTSTMFSGSF